MGKPNLSANVSSGNGGGGGFGVTPLVPNAPSDGAGGGIIGPSQTPASGPVLHIGVDAAVHGCSVDIDNVLFDVR